jgi:hypothetical protein
MKTNIHSSGEQEFFQVEKYLTSPTESKINKQRFEKGYTLPGKLYDSVVINPATASEPTSFFLHPRTLHKHQLLQDP